MNKTPARQFEADMKKASEYRQHAQECRQLAATMDSAEQRNQLMQMAEHWDKLAADRAALVGKHPELAHRSEREEERSFDANRSSRPDRPI